MSKIKWKLRGSVLKMASANHLLKGGGTLLLSSCNRGRLINGDRVPFSLLSLTKSKPSLLAFSSISLFPSPPPPFEKPKTRYNLRCLCTTADASSFVDSSLPSPSPAPPSLSQSPPTRVPDMAAVKEAANSLDIRVGKVLKAWRHPDADSLYVEEVDIGEPEPRTICSGLVNYVSLDDLQDKKVVVLANLKPRNMRGIKSCGMLMAASDASHENVELLVPRDDSVPGERIWFGSEDDKESQPAAASPNQIQKKKVWELVQPHLKTDAARIAMLDGQYMRTSTGPVVSGSLRNANIS